MFTVTPQAEAKILEFMEAQKGKSFLKVQVQGKTATEFLVHFLLEDHKKETESQFDLDAFSILYDTRDASKINNATIEWVESVSGSGFRINNPNKPENNLDSPLAARVQEIFDTEINPSIAAHGGNIELLDIKDGRAFVKMSGGCQGCSSAAATLKQGVEVRVKELIPEITELVDTTDHAEGNNPYYA